MSRRSGAGTRLYVGNLPPDVRERDIEDVFRKYGKITALDLRNKKGPPFCFVDFDDARDADDAIRGRDGYDLDGYKIRVEVPRSYRDAEGRFSNPRYERPGGRGFRTSNSFNKYSSNNMRRSKYRVCITGLPVTASWQDLKDHMREAGDVCYADVNKDGTGIVEYLREEDMKYAIKKLDDTKMRTHERREDGSATGRSRDDSSRGSSRQTKSRHSGDSSYIRVRADDGTERSSRRSKSRSRSRSPASGERSRSRSPIRKSSPKTDEKNGNGKRGRSASPSKSRSHSPADRSKSKSPANRSEKSGAGSRSPSAEPE